MVDLEKEQKHLDYTCKVLKAAYGKEKEFLNFLTKDALIYNQEMIKETSNDFDDMDTRVELSQYLNSFQSKQNSLQHATKKVNKYEKMLYKPYFGRIDFKEVGSDVEQYYIGISNFMDHETLEIMVCDWRAPISNMFYESNYGEMAYEAPEGNIKGELSLKRHFLIENAELVHYYDLKEHVSDNYLLEVLSQNSNKKLYPIVQSIQKKQNDIIRSNDVDLLYVNGVPGSGKSIIALHRMAYLLYHGQKKYDHNNMLVLSPNNFFKQYIEAVLPELGEEQVKQKTFEELIEEILGTRNLTYDHHINRILNNQIKVAPFKNTKNHFILLKRWFKYYLKNVHEFEDIYYNNRLIVQKEQMKNDILACIFETPIEVYSNKFRSRINSNMDTLKRETKKKMRKITVDLGNHPLHPDEATKKFSKKKLEVFYNKVNKVLSFNPHVIFHKMLEHKEKVLELGADLDVPQNFFKSSFNYDDYYAVLCFKFWISADRRYTHIRSLVIDEAQDYTYLQYHLFSMMFPKANYTILGDVNQTLHYKKTSNLNEDVKDIFKPKSHIDIDLNTCYRSTESIIELANTYMDIPINNIGRRGTEPLIISSKKGFLKSALAKQLGRLNKDTYKTLAIITATAELSADIHHLLKDDLEITHLKNSFQTIKHDHVVLPIYYAKGLEFDAVIYVRDTKNRTIQGQIDYTAITRAKHHVGVINLK